MQNKLNVTLALLAGLAGGMLTRFVAPPTVSAQDQPPPVQEIRARSFVFVDAQNRTVGTFSVEPAQNHEMILRPGQPPLLIPGRSRITLRDDQGREIWSAGPGARVMALQAFR